MSNFVLVMGESGSGKSTAIKGLDPNETIIINVLGKRLPFKSSKKLYNAEKKNEFKISSWESVIKMLAAANKKETVKNVVIDK